MNTPVTYVSVWDGYMNEAIQKIREAIQNLEEARQYLRLEQKGADHEGNFALANTCEDSVDQIMSPTIDRLEIHLSVMIERNDCIQSRNNP